MVIGASPPSRNMPDWRQAAQPWVSGQALLVAGTPHLAQVQKTEGPHPVFLLVTTLLCPALLGGGLSVHLGAPETYGWPLERVAIPPGPSLVSKGRGPTLLPQTTSTSWERLRCSSGCLWTRHRSPDPLGKPSARSLFLPGAPPASKLPAPTPPP